MIQYFKTFQHHVYTSHLLLKQLNRLKTLRHWNNISKNRWPRFFWETKICSSWNQNGKLEDNWSVELWAPTLPIVLEITVFWSKWSPKSSIGRISWQILVNAQKSTSIGIVDKTRWYDNKLGQHCDVYGFSVRAHIYI